jgi:hypothetical protein
MIVYHRLRSWLKLSWPARLQEVEAAWTIGSTSLVLRLGFDLRQINAPENKLKASHCPVITDLDLRSIRRWQGYLGQSCLIGAVAAQKFLRRRGVNADLHFGVKPEKQRQQGEFAHCWLEIQGRVVFGEIDDLQQYQRLG